MPKIKLQLLDMLVEIDSGQPLDEVSNLAIQHMDRLVKLRAGLEGGDEDESPADSPEAVQLLSHEPIKPGDLITDRMFL